MGTNENSDGTAQQDESSPSAPPPQPPIFISPPLALDSKICSEDSETRQGSLLGKVLKLLKGAKLGTDLSSFQVPAQLNLPKSQLQCYGEQVFCCGENLLEACVDGASPLERFLAVVRWHISLIRPAPFGKAPYNPILGETHHVTAGDLSLLTEQVSHHPPISALYATNSKKRIEILQWNSSRPKFCGNSVAVSVDGSRTLTLLSHNETYEMTSAKLNLRFWPTTCCEWIGDTVVKCSQSGLQATVTFKSSSFFFKSDRNQVSGTISQMSSRQPLFTISGSWDKVVIIEEKETSKRTALYDGAAALTSLKTTKVTNGQALSPLESVVVWRDLTWGIWNQNWELAREAKKTVEETQRTLRKQRARAGKSWKPRYFRQTDNGGWEWARKNKSVPPAPLTC